MISRNGKRIIFTKSSGPNKTNTHFVLSFNSSLFTFFCFLQNKAKVENLCLGLVKVLPKFSPLPPNNNILLLVLFFPQKCLHVPEPTQ